MTDYIRRQDAVEAVAFGITIASAFNKETGERIDLFAKENEELQKAIERIREVPSADVASVVYAHWIDGYRWQTCSKCRNKGKRSWKFCPNCGAKMDGEE